MSYKQNFKQLHRDLLLSAGGIYNDDFLDRCYKPKLKLNVWVSLCIISVAEISSLHLTAENRSWYAHQMYLKLLCKCSFLMSLKISCCLKILQFSKETLLLQKWSPNLCNHFPKDLTACLHFCVWSLCCFFCNTGNRSELGLKLSTPSFYTDRHVGHRQEGLWPLASGF